ncbi:MAG: NPCBM/NEW2 domain-containing protein [Lachnospiraceae bacterium]|nr:NPCBM/NEW2 domain-containing protein [Lachnospiraceae bacterium]
MNVMTKISKGLFGILIGVLILLAGGSDIVHAESVHYLRPYQWDNVEVYDSENVEHSFMMMGKKYTHGLKTTQNWAHEADVEFNLEGKVTLVSFLIGHIDNDNNDEGELKIYLDGMLQDNYTEKLTSDMTVKNKSINVKGKKQLKIRVSGGDARYGIADIIETDKHNYICDYTKPATVQEEGALTYTCKDCGCQYTEKVEAKKYCTNYILPYQTDNIKIWEENEGSDQALTVMGKQYYRAISSIQNWAHNGKAYYNLDRKYSSVSFSVGHLDNDNRDNGKLCVYKDNIQVEPVELTCSMQNIDFNISTTGITQLRIEIEGGDARYAIFDLEATPISAGNREHSFREETLVEAQFGVEGSIRHVCSVCGAYYITTSPALTRDLSEKDISVKLSATEYTYDGSEKKPTISVSYGRDNLVAGKDFSVSYFDNINPGEAKVIITGMGGYTGSVTHTFKINASKTAEKNNANTGVSNTNSKSSNNNTVLSSKITINIKNKKTYKKSKKVTISSNVYLRSVTLNGKNIITSNYLKKVSFKLSKYKKKLKKKGKWNKLVVTNSYGRQKTIKFKTK